MLDGALLNWFVEEDWHPASARTIKTKLAEAVHALGGVRIAKSITQRGFRRAFVEASPRKYRNALPSL